MGRESDSLAATKVIPISGPYAGYKLYTKPSVAGSFLTRNYLWPNRLAIP
jgi:hypothetical protein